MSTVERLILITLFGGLIGGLVGCAIVLENLSSRIEALSAECKALTGTKSPGGSPMP